MTTSNAKYSPPIMRESLVGLSHAVDVFFLLHGCSASIGSVEQLVSELIDHAFFSAGTAIADDPANRERSATVWIHFHRNLIVRAANAAGLHFKQRLAVLDCLLEEF